MPDPHHTTDAAGDDPNSVDREHTPRPERGPARESGRDVDHVHDHDHEHDRSIEARVEAALRAVRDPAADVTVFEAGLVESIDVSSESDGGRGDGHEDQDGDGGKDGDEDQDRDGDGDEDEDGVAVTVEAAVGALDADAAREATAAMARAVRSVPGVESARVEQVAPDADSRADGVAGFDTVIAVASAKGGVGKSTVAAGLACAMAGDREVGLFDADVYGPNAPTLLDVEGPVHADDAGDPVPVRVPGPGGESRAELELMSVGLLESGGPLAWRGAMAHDAVADLYGETAWGVDDTLVVDLPPGTGDVALTTLQEVPVDGVVIVTTPFASSLADAARSVALFREEGVPVLGVVRNMDGFTCPSCGDTHDLFAGPEGGDDGESTAETLDAPTLATVPFSRDLQDTPVPGAVPSAFEALARAVDEALASAWSVELPDGDPVVDLRGRSPDERRDLVEAAFAGLDPGGRLWLVSDRDPTPVRGFLAELVDCRPADVAPFEVERRTPDDWVARVGRPSG
jgi:ATP-binding protein involved in chromosome partitioning